MKKRFGKISVIFTLIFLALALSIVFVAIADNYTDDIGVTWTYTVDNQNMTATLTGANLQGQTASFSIPSEISNGTDTYKVVAIAEGAFDDKKVFGNLTLPDGLITIGKNAFKDSYIYGDVVIPQTVEAIGEGAFENCYGITSVTLSDKITVIEANTFSSCYALSSINSENIVTFKSKAFYNCKSLLNMTIGENAREIGKEVFYNCECLNGSYNLSKIETIEENAFYKCNKISSFTVPDKIHNSNAYNTCTGVTEYLATENNEVFCSSNGVLLSKDKTAICSYPPNKADAVFRIDDTVTTINKGAFINTINLEKVILTENVVNILPEAFISSSITCAFIPDNIRTVSVDVFKNCTRLEWVVLGANVIAVGCDSFYNTPKLRLVIAKNENLLKPDGTFEFYYAKDYECINHFYGYNDKEPDCDNFGYNVCVACDRYTYVKELGHTGAIIESASMSCKTDAYRIVECLRCNETVKVITEKTPGHISNGVVAFVPASFKTPSFKYSTCIVCNEMYAFDYHADFSIIGDVNCDGKINESDLTVLEAYVKDNSSVTDISTANADILRDGKVNQDDINTLKQYLLGYIDELPTRTINCTNHGRKGTIEIVSATCENNGFRIRFCLNCGKLTDEIFEAKLKHTLVEEKVIYANCSIEGQVVSSCTVCNQKVYESLKKHAHKHNWYTIASKRGYEYSTCENCGTFESRVVDYSAYDSLMGQIPEYYEVYYATETIVKIEPIIFNYKLTLTQKEVDKNVKDLIALLPTVQYRVYDVPVIFIDAKTINKNEYNEAKIIVAYRDENGKTQVEAIEYNGEVKIRGNSTAGMDKKPYNFKFSSKVDLFGMGASKKYSLLANRQDDIFIKNALTFELETLLGLDYGCKYEIVDVYTNGNYNGSYMLTTSVEVGEDRVDIDENYDYLLEIEKEGAFSDADCIYLKSPLFNINFKVQSPEFKDLSAESLSNLRMLVANIDYAIMSGDWELIQQYVDVESVAKYFILHDYLKEIDIAWDSTRFYIEDGKLHGGPAWDFDRCMFTTQDEVKADGGGTAFGERSYYDRNTEGCVEGDTSTGVWASMTWLSGENSMNDRIWFCSLYKHSPEFVILLCETVEELSGNMSLLYEDKMGEDGKVERRNVIDSIILDENIAESLRRNRTQYGIINFNTNIENVRTWLQNRCEWMQTFYAFKLATLSPVE